MNKEKVSITLAETPEWHRKLERMSLIDYKEVLRQASTPLVANVRANVRASEYNIGAAASGAKFSFNEGEHIGKVHIFGRKGKQNLLRIYELGTYKQGPKIRKDGTTSLRIRPQYFFSDAVEESADEVREALIAGTKEELSKVFDNS